MRTARSAAGVAVVGFALVGLVPAPETTYGYCFAAKNREAGGGSYDSPPTAEGAQRWAHEVWPPGDTLDFWLSSDNWPAEAVPPEDWLRHLQTALSAWSDIATADIAWRAAGVVSGAGRALDGLNTVYVSPPDEHPGGTSWRRTNENGVMEIIERDQAMHPGDIVNWEKGVLTLVHGMGHGLGLCHTASFPIAREDGHTRYANWPQTELWPTNNMMSYGPDNYSREGELGADEIVGASLLRPASGWIETTGSIAGRLRRVDGTPAAHAHVWALSRDGSSMRGGIGAFSQLDGSFRIEGLPPGDYVLWAHPVLSQRAFSGMIRDRYPDAVLDLDDAIWPHLVRVRNGQTTDGIEIQMRRGREARPFLATRGATGSPQPSAHGQTPAAAARRSTLAQLVRHSQHIVAGEVLDTQASWAAGGRSILTTVTLRVERRLKGAAEGGPVRFHHLGGAVGNISLSVSHTPHFDIGETVLVFLRDQAGELPAVVEGDAGKRQILIDGDASWQLLPHPLDPIPNPSIQTVEDLATALPRLEAEQVSGSLGRR